MSIRRHVGISCDEKHIYEMHTDEDEKNKHKTYVPYAKAYLLILRASSGCVCCVCDYNVKQRSLHNGIIVGAVMFRSRSLSVVATTRTTDKKKKTQKISSHLKSMGEFRECQLMVNLHKAPIRLPIDHFPISHSLAFIVCFLIYTKYIYIFFVL